MNAEIVAVGSEMLTPSKVDTNSLYLTDKLNLLGVEVVQKCIVGDDRARLTATVAEAMRRSELVILIGGLGPTEDDLTRESVAAAAGRELLFDARLLEELENKFLKLKRKMAENNKRQAYRIDGAEAIPNDRGSAPGQWLEIDGRIVVLLPGPPKELKAMWEQQCHERLAAKLPARIIATRFYRVAGMGESDLDHLIAPVYTRYSNPVCTILAGPSDIQIHLRCQCDSTEEAEALLQDVCGQIEPLLGDRLYSRNGEDLETVVGGMLLNKTATLSVAESCTGGLLAGRITNVAGSASYFQGGFLTYNDGMKMNLLGVSKDVLEQHTAVSEPVACAMATGARERTASDYALSVTGLAGPGGGTEEIPTGTVWIGYSDAQRTFAKRYFFMGDRARVRTMAVQSALDLLRLQLL